MNNTISARRLQRGHKIKHEGHTWNVTYANEVPRHASTIVTILLSRRGTNAAMHVSPRTRITLAD